MRIMRVIWIMFALLEDMNFSSSSKFWLNSTLIVVPLASFRLVKELEMGDADDAGVLGISEEST